MKKKLILVFALLALGGCGAWPIDGQGGMAEVRPPTSEPQSESMPEYLQLMREMSRLEEFKRRGAFARYPGHVVNADLLAVEIRRELAGDLIADARVRLVRLSAAIDTMENLLGRPVGPEF